MGPSTHFSDDPKIYPCLPTEAEGGLQDHPKKNLFLPFFLDNGRHLSWRQNGDTYLMIFETQLL